MKAHQSWYINTGGECDSVFSKEGQDEGRGII